MDLRKRSNIYGWTSENEVAGEIYCSPFRDLLEGNLVFAYKNLFHPSLLEDIRILSTLFQIHFDMLSEDQILLRKDYLNY